MSMSREQILQIKKEMTKLDVRSHTFYPKQRRKNKAMW